MKICGLEWDDNNYAEIAKHNVTRKEVEEVCFGLHFSKKDTVPKSKGKERYILAGRTSRNRYLDVIIERMDDNRFRTVTAFDMSQKYINIFLDRLDNIKKFESRKEYEENQRKKS